jgi:hypothetical protein
MSKVKLSLIFFRSPFTKWDYIYNIVSTLMGRWNEYIHCYPVFTVGDKSYVFVAARDEGTVRPCRYDAFIKLLKDKKEKPNNVKIVDLGERDMSIRSILQFTSHDVFRYAHPIEALFWYFIGRFCLVTHKPWTCSMLSCFILRLSGVHVPNLVYPKDLLKELIDEANYPSWTSESWEDYVCPHVGDRSV